MKIAKRSTIIRLPQSRANLGPLLGRDAHNINYHITQKGNELGEEVCPTCYKFLQSIYDRKRMKNVKQLVVNDNTSDNKIRECKSLYHKKLTDGFKSSF
jgi:hypothetical protein